MYQQGPRLPSANDTKVEASWNVLSHAQKPDFVFRRNGRVHLNRRGRQFSRLLAAEVCASAVVILDTPCSEVVWRVLATHSIRQFPLHFPSRTSPCAITFQLDSTTTKLSIMPDTWKSKQNTQFHMFRSFFLTGQKYKIFESQWQYVPPKFSPLFNLIGSRWRSWLRHLCCKP